MLIIFVALFSIVYSQPEVVYLLRTTNGTVEDVVSSPPDRGYMTKVFDLSEHQASFPKLHVDTAFDSNMNTFIIGYVQCSVNREFPPF